MRCHVCGASMSPGVTDLPFKVQPRSIVILKDLPVWQCSGCREYLLEDHVLAQVDRLLDRVEAGTELKIVRYAA